MLPNFVYVLVQELETPITCPDTNANRQTRVMISAVSNTDDLVQTDIVQVNVRKASKRVVCELIRNITTTFSSLQLPLDALDTQDDRVVSNLLRIECSVVEAIPASRAPKAFFMPFTTQSLNILANDRSFTLLAFRCSSFCSLSLAT